jgi:hypothetical protein
MQSRTYFSQLYLYEFRTHYWYSELSSGLYCRVKWLSTDVSVALVVCCPGIISSLWAFRQRKLLIFFGPWRMTWDWKLLVSTAYRASVVKFTLGRLAVLLIPGSRNTTGTFVWPSQTNRQWLNTASAGDIASNSKTPRYYPPNPVTLIGLSRRLLRSSFIRTTWTGRMVSFLDGHGNHLSTPRKHVESPRTGVVGTSVLLRTTQPSAQLIATSRQHWCHPDLQRGPFKG